MPPPTILPSTPEILFLSFPFLAMGGRSLPTGRDAPPPRDLPLVLTLDNNSWLTTHKAKKERNIHVHPFGCCTRAYETRRLARGLQTAEIHNKPSRRISLIGPAMLGVDPTEYPYSVILSPTLASRGGHHRIFFWTVAKLDMTHSHRLCCSEVTVRLRLATSDGIVICPLA
jgi:hypothetical protein